MRPLQARGSSAASVGVTPLQALTLGLATARLTRLVVEDEITEPARMAVAALVEPPSHPVVQGGQVHYKATEPPRQPWDWIDTAINCYACTSVWAGGGVLAAQAAGPVGRFLVRVLAFSQTALAVKTLIERIER